jgi:hypothetical protein
VSTEIADQVAELVIGGPHPILDALLTGEPEGSHVLDLFQPADEYQRAQFAVAQAPAALEPDAVHDPEPVQLITAARLISSTPTGSLRLAVPTRTMSMAEAMAWHDEQRYLASLADRPLMGQDA